MNKTYIYNYRTMCIHIFQNDLSNIITTYLHFFQMISIPCLQNISIFTDCFQIIISQINNKYKSLWKLLHVHWRKVFIKKERKQKQKVVPFLPPPPIPFPFLSALLHPPPYSHLPSPPSHFPPNLGYSYMQLITGGRKHQHLQLPVRVSRRASPDGYYTDIRIKL